MPARQRVTEIGAARARAAVAEISRAARQGRIGHGLSQVDVARALGVSRSRYSRMERGLVPNLSIEMAGRMLAAVGLELSIRAYPAGEPLRDGAHALLLDGFRAELSPSLRLPMEVPLPQSGDRRAWDAVVSGEGWRFGVEGETRPTDMQALERRIALKERDGGVDGVILVLADTRHNRALLRTHAAALRERFPMPGGVALACLREGRRPPGSAIVLIPLRRRASGAHS